MRRRRLLSALAVLMVMLASAWTVRVAAQNADAKVLAEFKAKVDGYDALRNDLAKKAPPQKKTDDPQRLRWPRRRSRSKIKIARQFHFQVISDMGKTIDSGTVLRNRQPNAPANAPPSTVTIPKPPAKK